MTRFASGFALLALSSELVLIGCTPPDEAEPHEPVATGDASSSEDSSTSEDLPVECSAAGSGPTMHEDSVAGDEIWRAQDNPHVIPNDIGIYGTVTLEPCARVQLAPDVSVTVGAGGSIIAEGSVDQDVVIERRDADEPWASIRLTGGTMQLFRTIVDGGGDPLNSEPYLAAAILARARDGSTAPDGVLRVDEVEIRRSASQGIRLHEYGAFTENSRDLTIVDAAGHPITSGWNGAGSIPSGDYTGNRDDRVLVTDALVDIVAQDMTLHDRGVPYVAGGPGQIADLRVDAGAVDALAVLTLEPGVELQFRAGSVMRIDYGSSEESAHGALVAVGTADAPIVFTSAEDAPAAGDWLGLVFEGSPGAVDALQHVRVEFAGGDGAGGSSSCSYAGDPSNDAGIRIQGAPTHQFITDTAIVASARHGIDRGWRADTLIDFIPGNDFDVAECRQTFPKSADGSCPEPVPCP